MFCCFRKVLIIILTASHLLTSATNWYVSSENGKDILTEEYGTLSNKPFLTLQFAHDQTLPGDTVFIMDGIYRNLYYNEAKVPGTPPDSLFNPPIVKLTHSGNAIDGAITFINFSGHHPVLKFDGQGGFIGDSVSYINIVGLHIQGSADLVTQEEALNFRLDMPRPFYYNGEGIWVRKSSTHIIVENCLVEKCTASGIKSSAGDYILFKNNTVRQCAWYSSKGTKGIVVNRAVAIDTSTASKIIVMNNIATQCWNEIPFYNGKGDSGSGYGEIFHTSIVDGHGITITQCNDPKLSTSYDYGRILVLNNVCFQNGLNGISFNKSARGDIINNTAWENNMQPGNSINGGIKARLSDDILMANNIAVGNTGLEVLIHDGSGNTNFTATNNLYFNGSTNIAGQTMDDPQFKNISSDIDSIDLSLSSNSPAINAGITFTPRTPEYFQHISCETDIVGNSRESWDIGAYEYSLSSNIDLNSPILTNVYPNPTQASIYVEYKSNGNKDVDLRLLDLQGKIIKHINDIGLSLQENRTIEVNCSNLPNGIYFLSTELGDYQQNHKVVINK